MAGPLTGGTAPLRGGTAGAGALAAGATLVLGLTLAACGSPHPSAGSHGSAPHPGSPTTTAQPTTTTTPALAPPAPLTPFATAPPAAAEGTWSGAGRRVGGAVAVYETLLVPPGGTQPAGVAWMDTRLLSARLYSGSISPGGGPWPYTAPVQPAQATSLVAAFNGGFKMQTAGGGYYTTGKTVDTLVAGAASLVVSTEGSVAIGAWGRTVTMTPAVASVRQNLVLLVDGGRPTAAAQSPDWHIWGNTCGATACTPGTPGIEDQWRSGLGVTADGALVYVTGPALAPAQLAALLVRAGAVRAMELDINPYWPVFVTYAPATPAGPAAPANGTKLLATTTQGPATFFDPAWARDFVTMSARFPAAAA